MAKQDFSINTYGRFVSGDLLEKKTTDHKGKTVTDTEKHKFNFGIAFRKDDPAFQAYLNELYTYLSTQWANDQVKLQALQHYFTPNPQTGYSNMTGLSLKMSDGDLPSGKDNVVNKNTVGCVVLWCATKYPPKITDSAYQEIPTESMKRGYYCAIVGTFDDNQLAYSADGKGAGVYLNINGLVLLAEGDPIESSGMNVEAAMRNAAPLGAMPTGARALGSSAGMPQQGMPQQGMPGQMGNVQPQFAPVGGAMGHGVTGNVPHVAGGTTNPNGVQGQPPMGAVGTQVGQPNVIPGTVSNGNVGQMPNAHPGILGTPATMGIPNQ